MRIAGFLTASLALASMRLPYLRETEGREIEQNTQNPPLASTQLRMKNICTITYTYTYKTHTICLTIVTRCVYLCVFMHVCMSLYVYICEHMCICICVCVCMHVFVCVYVCMSVSVYMHVCVGMCDICINKFMTHNDLVKMQFFGRLVILLDTWVIPVPYRIIHVCGLTCYHTLWPFSPAQLVCVP